MPTFYRYLEPKIMTDRIWLIFLFYRSFAVFSAAISMALWTLADYALNEQFWRFLPLYILLKILTNSLIWYHSRKYHAERMLFYSNKNISETTLFVSAFLLDAGLFFLLVAFISILL